MVNRHQKAMKCTSLIPKEELVTLHLHPPEYKTELRTMENIGKNRLQKMIGNNT